MGGGVRKTFFCGDYTDGRYFNFRSFLSFIFRRFAQNKKYQKKSKSFLRADWGTGRDFFAYFQTLYMLGDSFEVENKKITQNHHCVAIGCPYAMFCLFLDLMYQVISSK